MPEQPLQLDLFDAIHLLYQEGMDHLFALRIEKAAESFQRFEERYPGYRDLSLELSACEALSGLSVANGRTGLDGLLQDAAQWGRIERDLTDKGWTVMNANRLKSGFYQAICRAADEFAMEELSAVASDEEIGAWYYQAGKFDKALTIFESAVLRAQSSSTGLVWSRIGNIHYHYGRKLKARSFYREAFFRDPEGIRIEDISDSELKEFINDLEYESDFPDPSIFWIAPAGLIRKIFPYPDIRTKEHLLQFVDGLQKNTDSATKIPAGRGKAFYCALVLAEELRRSSFESSVNEIDLRRTMKQSAPDLFQEYLESLNFG